MNLINPSPNPKLGKEVHITSAGQLRSRVQGNLQARFCRRGWRSDSPLDSTKLSPDRKRITFTDKFKAGTFKLVGSYDLNFYHLKAIKRVRLIRRADGYYCQFVIAVERNVNIQPTVRAVGIDVGIAKFYTTSDGEIVENPRHLRQAEKALKKAQRRVSSKFVKPKKKG